MWSGVFFCFVLLFCFNVQNVRPSTLSHCIKCRSAHDASLFTFLGSKSTAFGTSQWSSLWMQLSKQLEPSGLPQAACDAVNAHIGARRHN